MKYPILLPNIFNFPFTYESDINLKVGDYVVVPFGKSKITGVVLDNLYLVGHCYLRDEKRTFRVDRIKGLKISK